jgi:D-aminopeptidase
LRLRELGISVGHGAPGPANAITDVPGVRVGHETIIRGDGNLEVGKGPVRTGVTVILPHEGNVWAEAVFAGCHRLNGNGELTGLEWIRESGMLASPIALTNTHSVGVVRDALIADEIATRGSDAVYWGLPVVGETFDGLLNDINGFHVGPAHVAAAMRSASTGPVLEGGVGGGTGMTCHGFKGGIGTSSRVLASEQGGYVVGVLVQANHGRRPRLLLNGVPVGEEIGPSVVPVPESPAQAMPAGSGSIIVIIATNAPLLPQQCSRLAQRAGLGIGRTGGMGEHTSGDMFLAFATGNRGISAADAGTDLPLTMDIKMLINTHINPFFEAVIDATEEAIWNALIAAETIVGRDGITAYGFPNERLRDIMAAYRRA